jgi:hypothetical protein|tara:strand:- start:133 stop:351 length:219 start_codon:yes stop_codon:yes gene_type:complete
MKIKKVVNVLQIIDENKIPSDVEDIMETKYFSEGRNKDIEIGEMDLYHLLRCFNLLLIDRRKLNRILTVIKE